MKNIDTEGIIRLLVSQCRGADLWISQWERFKDASSVRNAAMALGKIQGVYNVLLTIPVAIGLCLIAAFLTHQQTMRAKSGDDLKDAFNAWGFAFFMGLIMLFMGWVVKSFFM